MSREKIGFIIGSVFVTLLAFAISWTPIINMSLAYEEQSLQNESPIPIDSIDLGTSKAQILEMLGEPNGQALDDSVYYYFRHIQELNKDQVVVVLFKDDKVLDIDSNISVSGRFKTGQ